MKQIFVYLICVFELGYDIYYLVVNKIYSLYIYG